ncbi:MAG: CBS domain-containing protein [Gallionella sp.]
MTTNVVSIDREKLVCEVEGLFVKKNISAAPVVDEAGKILSLVTKSDINRFHFTDGDPYYTHAWEIASPDIVTINESASILEAANLMLDKHLHHLMVVDAAGMVGLLSSFDFIRMVANARGTSESRLVQ